MDVALDFKDGVIDINFKNGDIALDETLKTPIILSLLCDARGEKDGKMQRGYWGDSLLNHEVGSLFWLLEREKLDDSVLGESEEYAKAALTHLVDDGFKEKIEIRAKRSDDTIILYADDFKFQLGEI